MKGLFWTLVLFSCNVFANTLQVPLNISNEEDALFLRRVVEFFEENDFAIVKQEIHQYLMAHPHSSLNEYLFVILGDLYMEEKDYARAIAVYSHVKSETIKEEISINLIQCLYEKQRYEDVVFYCIKYLKTHTDLSREMHDQIIFCLGDCFYQIAMASGNDTSKQKIYAGRAKNCFKSLLNTSYRENALIYLSHIYQLLENYALAGDIFLALAKNNKAMQEEYLFQAAVFFSEKDAEKAIEILDQVMNLKAEKYSEAALFCVQLLFFSEKYQEIIDRKHSLQKALDPIEGRMINWYVGKSWLRLQQYTQAIDELKHFVELEKRPSDMMHEALLDIMKCAVSLADQKVYEKAYILFEENYSEDEQMPLVLFARACLEKDPQKALSLLERIEEQYPAFEKRSHVILEMAQLLFSLQQAEKSRQMFLTFIQTYTDNADALQKAWDGLVEASLLIVMQKPDLKKESAQLVFIQDLQNYLTSAPLITEEKKEELSYALACMEFEVRDYAHAIEHFEILKRKQSQHERRFDILQYLAFSYRFEGNYEKYCLYLTQAMESIAENNEKKADLHLMLYNGYLQLAKEDETFLQKAADHLFEAQRMNNSLSEENLLWLADYYYHRLQTICAEDYSYRLIDHPNHAKLAMRAIEILSVYEEMDIEQPQQLPYEHCLLQLAEINFLLEKEMVAIKILQHLQSQYQKNISLPWKYQEKAYYLYAKYNEGQKNYDEALHGYRKAEQLATRSYFSLAASLGKLRILIHQLANMESSKTPKLISAYLSQLKTLCLKRYLQNEPLHLEASFAYIDLRASLETDPIKKAKKKRELIDKIKKDYVSDSIMSLEYQKARKQDAKKDAIYQSYMEMMEIEQQLCQYHLAATEQKQEVLETAKNLLTQYQENHKILTMYLLKRWERNVQLLEQYENEWLSSQR